MKRVIVLLGFGMMMPLALSARSEARVILYQHADYRGDSLELYPGDTIENCSGLKFPGGSGLNDSVSSIRVEGGAEVYVYADSRFRGPVMRLTESARDLTGRLLSDNPKDNWNDRISSLKVEKPRPHSGGNRQVDYDAVIKRAYKDLLGRDPDEDGLRNYRSRMIDQGWTDKMVRDEIRRGVEFRQAGADQIIRRAYQDLLGREADAGGLSHYRKLVIDRNWTEGDVRDDLRKSAEYKNRPKKPGA